jgi:hypothetical protein
VGGHRQRRTCPNTCMYAEGRPDTECEDEYMHIRISHGPRQGACKRSCDTYLHRDIDSEDRSTRIHTTNFSTEVHIIHDTGNITAKMQTAACRLASL